MALALTVPQRTGRVVVSDLEVRVLGPCLAGNTEMLIGRWHGRFVHVPMPLATRFRKQVDTSGDLWTAVVESTGQPVSWGS